MEKFFLGGNTAQGFKGFYGSELARADNVVLLKGAPGTGKSTLIKRLGAECAERGLDHEMWYCSGDPSLGRPVERGRHLHKRAFDGGRGRDVAPSVRALLARHQGAHRGYGGGA